MISKGCETQILVFLYSGYSTVEVVNLRRRAKRLPSTIRGGRCPVPSAVVINASPWSRSRMEPGCCSSPMPHALGRGEESGSEAGRCAAVDHCRPAVFVGGIRCLGHAPVLRERFNRRFTLDDASDDGSRWLVQQLSRVPERVRDARLVDLSRFFGDCHCHKTKVLFKKFKSPSESRLDW